MPYDQVAGLIKRKGSMGDISFPGREYYTGEVLGEDLAGSFGMENPFLWQTKPWDEEVTLYYSRARYYEGKTGRFLGVDPLEGLSSGGKYFWPRCNPVLTADPSGFTSQVFGQDASWWGDLWAGTVCQNVKDISTPGMLHKGGKGLLRRILDALKGSEGQGLKDCFNKCVDERNPVSATHLLGGMALIELVSVLLKIPMVGHACTGAAAGFYGGTAFDCLLECWEDPCSH